MNTEVAQEKLFGIKSRRVLVISLITFILLMLAVTAQIGYVMLAYDKIYKGVYINELHIGGMKTSELEDFLKKEYDNKIKNTDIEFKLDNSNKKVNLGDLNVVYDFESAINSAYDVGRKGSLIERFREISKTSKNNLKINLPVTFDKQKLDHIINDLYQATLVAPLEPRLDITDHNAVIHSGQKGKGIDKSVALAEAVKVIESPRNSPISLSMVEVPPSKINADEYYNLLNQDLKEPKAAVVNNEIVFEPAIPGRSIDKAALLSIINEAEKSENKEFTLPVSFTFPVSNIEDIKSKVFKDTLATISTQFYTSTENDANRGENIKLAVSKINGKILAPGETFSFNNIVGPRTVAQGYKVAHVYSNGQIIDDVGGGICQVSTTLYNAALFSDLNITDRTNHMFTVGYIAKGQDAAVAYDYTDLKFVNSTEWPIKITGWVTNDNKVFFSLKGTNTNPGKAVEIVNKTVKTLEFATKYIDDPNLPEGQTYVKTYGMTGYIIDTYRITKQDGNIISENKIYSSTYNPLSQEVVRGTKKN